jgi:hypothetical protein
MRVILLRILVFVVILLLVFSPLLLVVDYERFSAFVLLIWLVSIAYFLLLKRRVDQRLKQLADKEGESDPESSPDVSRGTNENGR